MTSSGISPSGFRPSSTAAPTSTSVAARPSTSTPPERGGISTHAILEVLDSPDIDTRMFDHPYAGKHRLDQAIDQFILGDVLIHTWDLARATGQDEHLDPTMVVAMLAGLEPIVDVLASSGQYGPRVAVNDDADLQTKLLALTGRHAQ